MRTGFITFRQVLDYLEEGPYQVMITKGSSSVEMRFFAAEADWHRFAQALLTFPRSSTELVVFDARHREASRQSLLLEAYCYDELGHSALRIVADNNKPAPDRCRTTFSLPAEAASLNQLGALLLHWLTQPFITVRWEAQVS